MKLYSANAYLPLTLLSCILGLNACQRAQSLRPIETPTLEAAPIVVASPTPQSPFTFGFVPSQYENQIYSYQLNRTTGEILPTQQVSISSQTLPISTALSFDRRFLFAANYSSQTISAYQVNHQSGELILITHFALPANSNPGWISAHPKLPVLYIAHSGTGMIGILDIESGGQLSLRQLIPAGPGVTSFAVSGDGSSLFSAQQNADQLSRYQIDRTGGLTFIESTALIAGAQPNQIELSKSGRFLYVANWGTKTISAFDAQASGWRRLGPDVNAGNSVFSVNVSPDEKFAYGMQPYANQYSTHAVAEDGSLGPAVIRAKAGAVWMSFWSTFAYLTSWTYQPLGLAVETHTLDPQTGVSDRAIHQSTAHRGMYQMTILNDE